MQSEQLTRFISVLNGLFEMDKADLDFGLYRIINIRRKEIEHFLTDILPRKVEEVLKPFATDTKPIEDRLQEIEAQLGGRDSIAVLPATLPLVKEYQELKVKLANGVDLSALESDVYSLLKTFFDRYYEGGDFVSKRRYKEGIYAIPYEGEEVKLHWANQDQYYIKTSENLKNYTFKAEDYTIHFCLTDATTEQNNNKEAKGAKRTFMLYSESEDAPDLKTFAFDEKTKELTIRFIYDIPPTKIDSVADNAARITEWVKGNAPALLPPLLSTGAAKGKNVSTALEKHLRAYVARHDFDYFIHKDLHGFLSRELDFFIKNEVMHLDDLDTSNEQRVETYLAKVRAVKRVGSTIIDFLASIENFQRKLWLKKKFVVQCNYCITLDRIPADLHATIWENEQQRDTWQHLGILSEVTKETDGWTVGCGRKHYRVIRKEHQLLVEEKLSTSEAPDKESALTQPVAFLDVFGQLMADTKFFSEDTKMILLESIDDLDSQCDGLLIHSENFQALNLLQAKLTQRVKCLYLDPPYNTGSNNAFLYKDSFQHSSWLTSMQDRLALARNLLADFSGCWVSTDDGEYANLKNMMDLVFGSSNFVADIIWNSRKSVSNDALISVATNHTTFYAKNKPLLDKNKALFRTELVDFDKYQNPDDDPRGPWVLDPMDAPNVRENLSYPIVNSKTGETFLPPAGRHWRFEKETTEKYLETGRILFGRNGEGRPLFKRFLSEAQNKGLATTTLWDDVQTTSDATTMLLNIFGSSVSKVMIDQIKPKPIQLVDRMLQLLADKRQIAMDFFAGSGTTAHAVILRNRKDNGKRKYVLVEMGDHFDTFLLPRIQKVVFASDWKNGQPLYTTCATGGHIVKYMSLESYEDAMTNVSLRDEASTSQMFMQFGEEYLLKYLLDLNLSGSVLNRKAFNNPFGYKLKVTEKNETKEVTADLVETFNYLIGLKVEKMTARKCYTAAPDPKGDYEGAVKLTKSASGPHIFRQVEGVLPNGHRCLVIWRTFDEKNPLESNAALDAYFRHERINPQDSEFDVIYVNGDNNLENLRTDSETWKVRLIEPEFHDRMFEEA